MASEPKPPRPRPPPQHAKRRGSYNCGRCGLPKKGHVCAAPTPAAAAAAGGGEHRSRRALSFSDSDEVVASPEKKVKRAAEEEVEFGEEGVGEVVVVEEEEEERVEVGGGGRWVPAACLVEVMRRLAPRELMAAAAASRGWRECARRVWRAAEELRLRVAADAGVQLVGAILPRCGALARLALRMESDVDATMLACVAFSCPNLEALEISMSYNAVNRMTGDELNRFVSEKRCLSVLKVDGCSNLGFLNLSSSSLSTLWLSDICSLSKSVINCPNLNELSLDFSRQNNDSTDLLTLIDSLGRTCPNLRNMHIASIRLCNEAVFALESANLRGLCMLSLILGSKITDAAVASIIRSYASLELLDLSGSSISDNGVGMICKAFPHTLSRLLLALCPNITSFGIQLAAAQLPLLQLMDCGMSLCINSQAEEERSYFGEISSNIRFCRRLPSSKAQCTYQKLIIKHGNLKKLSLWGCSALDALYVNCPVLNDLNLNSCTNLHPERLLLQCPNLKNVHASGCRDMLIGAIRNQVLNEFAAAELRLPCKRLADGSKRVEVPHFVPQQQSEEEKWTGSRRTQCTVHLS